MTPGNGRSGIELPWVYDGISVWIEPDGRVVNRWQELLDENPDLKGTAVETRAALTESWLSARLAEEEAS